MIARFLNRGVVGTASKARVPLAVFLAATLAFVGQAYAQHPDTASGMAAVGNLSLEGIVTSVRQPKDGAIFLNFGGPYPHQTFAAVVFPSDARKFSNPRQWEGKYVRVTGHLETYQKRPAIIVKGPWQVKVVPVP